MVRFLAWVALTLFFLALLTRLIPYALGLHVTSWFRSIRRNREVGGKAASLHLLGLAVDVLPVNQVTLGKLNRLPFGKVVNEGSHIHFQLA